MFNFIISPRAKSKIAQTIDYLFENWNITVQENFTFEVERCIRIITKNPYTFAIDHHIPKVRKCTVTPLNILYYMIQENNIVVLSLEDTRMNPENIRL